MNSNIWHNPYWCLRSLFHHTQRTNTSSVRHRGICVAIDLLYIFIWPYENPVWSEMPLCNCCSARWWSFYRTSLGHSKNFRLFTWTQVAASMLTRAVPKMQPERKDSVINRAGYIITSKISNTMQGMNTTATDLW